jgi:lipoate---protein ligase
VKCRFLATGENRASINMGLDEAVLESVSKGNSLPVLRLYGWSPPAVSIGYFQSLHAEVNVDECERSGVDIVRRITGGGAVFHDSELTYSLICPQKMMPDDILKSYEIICGGIIEGLGILGIEACFAPLNDITAGGKKISGNAQTRRMGCVLQHGTILLDVDVKRMFSLLRVPDEKMRDKIMAAASDRVTSVRHMLKSDIGYDIAVDAFKRGFGMSLGLDYEVDEPSVYESDRASELAEEKYSSIDWIGKR